MLPRARIDAAFDCPHIIIEFLVRTRQQSLHCVMYDGLAGLVHVLDLLVLVLDKGKQVVHVVRKLMKTRLLNILSHILNINC